MLCFLPATVISLQSKSHGGGWGMGSIIAISHMVVGGVWGVSLQSKSHGGGWGVGSLIAIKVTWWWVG